MERRIMDKPLISVIVTVYNLEKYLDKCVKSIVAQTYSNPEIILVNDGSQDNSGKMCEAYAKEDARIKVLHKSNGGAVSARKAGIEVATGDYIGFVDGDDWIEDCMYESMARMCMEEAVDIVSIEDVREYADGRKQCEYIRLQEGVYKGEAFETYILSNIIDTNHFFQWNIPMHGWQHIYRRELMKKCFEQIDTRIRRGEDMMFALSCYLEANSVALIKKPFYHYRQVMNSARGTGTKKNLEGLLYLSQRLHEMAQKNERQKVAVQEQIRQCIFYTILWSAYEVFLSKEDDELFPYGVKKGRKIALVGAGAFGKRVYHRMQEFGLCRIEAWVDNGWELYAEQGLPVQSMKVLQEVDIDYAVIAVLSQDAQKQLVEQIERKGIEKNKIKVINQKDMTEDKMQVLLERLEEALRSV